MSWILAIATPSTSIVTELSIQNGAGVPVTDIVGEDDIVRVGVIDFVRVGDTVFEGVTEGVIVIVGV